MANEEHPQRGAASPVEGAAPNPTPGAKPGQDTTFFLGRVRQEMRTPLNQVLSLCERLCAQARMLGQDSLIPELEKIETSARSLIGRLEVLPGGVAQRSSDTENVGSKLFTPLDPTALSSEHDPTAVASPSHRTAAPASILVVDDSERSRQIVSLLLEQAGYAVETACDGEDALARVQARPFDLVLLDLMLPEFNGYQVLNLIKSNPAWRHLPVIMLSGAGDSDSVIRCIEAGAEDYLAKPFNPVLLRARIEASLEKKRLHDQERAFLKQLEAERETSERLLLNILPRPIADRLKHGEGSVVDNFAEITVLFADLAGFTRLTASLSPRDLVSFLNEVFSEFDRLAEAHGLEKIKTIGDAYMVVGGLPTPRSDHAEAVAEMALDMLQAMEQFSARRGTQLGLRIGIHTGPVIAGIIGKNKFSYDLWGDTVNIASRMESQGQPGSIQMTAESFNRLQGKYRFEKRGRLEVKGKGEMTTYLLTGRLPLSPAG